MKNTTIKEGIILIPDFSGFTEFVYNTKIYTGEYIVKELLTELIISNNQNFNISEIEGDAILFYKYSKKPSYEKTMENLRNMLRAFENKVILLSKSLNIKIDLSLKLIVHYGEFSKYQIKKFSKLYGATIVEAHQLLKNGFAERPSYILLSNSFLKSVKKPIESFAKNTQIHPEIGAILYREEVSLAVNN
ncbi:DUF2652 domain-containing protein [Flavobacterium sp. ARAG 55.4]|uniref:DUF2652 domain-containing protein n=1 Tax=Flavobacterium plantiphilum TaxID=3163297 RepID=A0ABW8XVJ3_9FLAO